MSFLKKKELRDRAEGPDGTVLVRGVPRRTGTAILSEAQERGAKPRKQEVA